MEKAWGLVLDEFPWMMAIPCVTHVLSLLMKDVGSKVPAISQLIEEERIVVGWFANHQKPLAILRQKCLDMWGHSKELVKAAATRFGTNTLVGQRLLQLEVPLRQTVSDVEYLKERYRDKANEMETTGCENKTRTHKGGTAAKLVSSTTDDNMWDRIRMHVDATLPIYKMLRRHDSSAPTIGKVYSGWFELGKSFTSSNAPYAADLKEFHEDRWSYGHCDILAAAYMLDPEFLGHDFNAEPEIKTGFFATIKHVAMLQYVKGNLENYQKAWEQRAAFLSKDPVHNIRKFDAYPLYDTEESKLFTIEFAKKAAAQHVLYEERHGPFAEEFIISAAEDMPAHLWWDKYGFCVKELQTVACYVLSQCPTASIIERINSDFAFIKDKKRNRLKHDRADKLVALFHNLRMVNKMKKCAYVESAVGWNEEDMHTGIQKWGVTHYDIKST
ncbi:hypothetical protein AB1Y20_012610 [Prymnesium parvum]|uniref:HAT C-terminal dimerisation domain-containing protein n=1 Tax=Prymnesium parvum TaxID=97485 RepID=A0AB34IJA0_PRYPA